MWTVSKPIDECKATVIRCGESKNFLSAMGIEGEIISTPSHSGDSVSLILDSGVCIVGDLDPIDYIGAHENNEALKADWERITSFGVHTVYYGHANEKNIQINKRITVPKGGRLSAFCF